MNNQILFKNLDEKNKNMNNELENKNIDMNKF